MKISELPYAESVTDSDYVLAVQNGQTVRATATAFKGASGSDGVNGVGIPTGGSAGEVLKKVDGTDYNTEWGAASGGVVDLTSATSDYALAVGETAYINYTSATSVPLFIKSDGGLYDIFILMSSTSTLSGDADAYLLPNNTNSINFVTSRKGDITTFSVFAGCNIGATQPVRASLNVNTATSSKSFCCHCIAKLSNGTRTTFTDAYSEDTTTAWTSLGTISFPFAQSGKIVIKRII